MPIRSSGCATCRKRKIRCDETRPGCQRCSTHGVPCPGYRTDKPGGIEFKDQTNITVKRAKDHYKAKKLHSTSTWKTGSSSSESPPLSAEAVSDIFTATAITTNHVIPIDEGFNETESSLALIKDIRSTSPIPLLSPGLERARLYNEFVETYLPKTTGGAQNGHFSFFQTIALKRSEQPALQQSLDALSLVQVGSIHKDEKMLKQAVKEYAGALSSLARSISKGQFLHDDDVLAAVTVMATCELYGEIQSMGEGWAKHVQGSNQLVAARGPRSLRSDLALLLYSNMRHGSLVHALISRKAPFMATPEWRAVAFRVPQSALDMSTIFYDITIQIPGLLQRHDELDLDSNTAIEDIDKILEESAKLEAKLRGWFDDWQASATFTNRIMYELRPIDEFPTFTSLFHDRAFEHAYTFPDFLVAYLHSLYWTVMHYLRTNTQSLHKNRHRIELDWYPNAASIVQEDELLGYILNLCQCIPFFVEPISSSTGNIGIFLPLRCAAMYFTEHGHWRWLEWIGSVRNSVFVKGLAPPAVKHKRGKVSPGP